MTKQDNNVEMMARGLAFVMISRMHHAPCTMVVLDPVKVIIENMTDELERVTMPNHPNKLDMGSREVYIDRADFREEANKQCKRLLLALWIKSEN